MLTQRHKDRLAQMVQIGIPQPTSDAAAKVLSAIAPNDQNNEWSIFADLGADPMQIQLWHEKTGVNVDVSIINL